MAILTTEHADIKVRVWAGALVGFIGGVVMAMFEMLYHALVTGMGALTAPDMIATLAGYPMHNDFGVYTVVGMTMHLIFSAFLGVLFGLALSRIPTTTMSTIAGLIYGFILYWIMFYLITPVVNPAFAQMGKGDPMPMITGHLFYGLGFIFYPMLVKGFSRRVIR